MSVNPFRRILGDALDHLPGVVRQFHSLTGPVTTKGRSDIRLARNPLAWLVCRVAGLPGAGQDVATTISFTPDGKGAEFWDRRFEKRRYASTMAAATGRRSGLLTERFGPFTLFFRLTCRPEGLHWRVEGWHLLGLPLPRWTSPRITCFETAEGERFVFTVDVAFPVIGPVVQYRGWLLPDPQPEPGRG